MFRRIDKYIDKYWKRFVIIFMNMFKQEDIDWLNMSDDMVEKKEKK